MRRYFAAITLTAALAACAQPQTITPADIHARDVALATQAKAINGTAPTTPEEWEIYRARAAQEASNNRAAAECNYVAKQAAAGPRYTGFGTGWLGPAFTNSFAGLMDGIVAGKNCQDYYRNIGVIR